MNRSHIVVFHLHFKHTGNQEHVQTDMCKNTHQTYIHSLFINVKIKTRRKVSPPAGFVIGFDFIQAFQIGAFGFTVIYQRN